MCNYRIGSYEYHIGYHSIDEGFSADRGEHYVSRNSERHFASEYLHSDGQWRGSTLNNDGVYSGYFKTHEEAMAAFKKATE